MLTPIQNCILNAIEAGHTTTRAIAEAVGLRSNATVAHHLGAMAARGLLVLESTPHGLSVYSGSDYAAGWDAAARLAGNPDA